MSAAKEFVRSPSHLSWTVFWLYLLFITLGTYKLSQTFKQKGILIGHLDDLFRFLTNFRVWSIKYRKAYTAVVTGVLSAGFLFFVYWSERLHYSYYGTEPVFAGVVDYVVWITVLVVSGLQQGTFPRSVLGLVLSGVYPLFVIGSVLTIVRYTSQDAHDALVKRMAEGDVAPYRILVFNYRERYDDIVRQLLERSSGFVVIFAKDEHLQDARSFVDGVADASTREYRAAIEELSYSEDVLFDQYNVLSAEEMYIFPDAETRTDYDNLRLVSRLNEEEKRRENDRNRAADPPSVVWLADSDKLSDIGHALESTQFKRQLHAMSFQRDVRDMVLVNTGESLRELFEYYNFGDGNGGPPWVRGYELSNYRFRAKPLTEAERDELDDLRQCRQSREATAADSEHDHYDSLKRRILSDIDERLRTELGGGDSSRVGPLFGLLANVAEASVPIELTTAYLSQQMETATASLQLVKRPHESADPSPSTTAASDVFLVNYNARAREFLLDFDAQASDHDRRLTVFTSPDQVVPEASEAVECVEYETTTELLDGLFIEGEHGEKRVEPGDIVVLFLDQTAARPEVQALQVLDALDDKLDADTTDVTHNDLLLVVESDAASGNEEYHYLSVDKVLETDRTQRRFLDNLIQLRNAPLMNSLIQEGKLTPESAFEWAVKTAHYLRKFRIENAEAIRQGNAASVATGEASVDALVQDHREFGRQRELPFTTFELVRDDEYGVAVELHELTRETTVDDGEYLLSLSQT